MTSFNASGIQPFLSFTLFGLWGILVSLVMYNSPDFGKGMAIIEIMGFVLEQGAPVGLYQKIWGTIDPIFIGIGGVFIIVWYFIVAIKLLRLSKQNNECGDEC